MYERQPVTRLEFIYGLHGIAVLLVVLYHFAAACSPGLIPDQSTSLAWVSDAPIALLYNGRFAVTRLAVTAAASIINRRRAEGKSNLRLPWSIAIGSENVELDYARHYRKWHPDTDEHYSSSSSLELQDLNEYLPDDRNSCILELGAGMGLCIFALRELGYRNVLGIDSDPSQVDAAIRRGLPVELVPVSETLNWLYRKDKSFDFSYAIDVLEHIPRNDIINVVRAIYDSLKAGSYFVCRVPNCNSIVGMRQRYIDWTHQESFSPESLDFVLYNSGFRSISIIEARPPPWLGIGGCVRGILRLLFRSIRRLQYFAEATGGELRMPLSSNLLAICRK